MRIHVLEKRVSGEEDGEERKRETERESRELRGREEKRGESERAMKVIHYITKIKSTNCSSFIGRVATLMKGGIPQRKL